MIIILKLYILIFFLIGLSYFDFRYHKIPNVILIPFALIGLCFVPFSKYPFSHLLGFIFPSIILFLLNLFLRNYIGSGDIKLFMCTGLYLGATINSVLYIGSLILASCFAIIRFLIRPQKRTPIAFCPFVLVTSLLLILYATYM